MTIRAGSFFADVRGTVLTGLSTATAGAIAATDTLLGALAKLQASLSSLAPLASPTFTGTVTIPTLLVSGFEQLDVTTGIVAAGTTLATAKALTTQVNVVSTSATGTAGIGQANGVSLPAPTLVSGMAISIRVINAASVAVIVFPPNSSSKIGAAAAGASVSLAAGATRDFTQVSATQYY